MSEWVIAASGSPFLSSMLMGATSCDQVVVMLKSCVNVAVICAQKVGVLLPSQDIIKRVFLFGDTSKS